jgi:Lysylphosphatidylglycerol synthase TM region
MSQITGTTLLTESQSRTRIAGVPLSQFLFGCATTVLGVGLCVLLLHWSGADSHHWLDLARKADLGLTAVALAGMTVNVLLAAKKWCRVEACLAGTPPSYVHAVAMTAIGMGVGQFFPTSIANVIVRGVGNRASRRSGRHGALASAWEQLFDLAAAALLTGPAIVALARGRVSDFLIGFGLAMIVGEVGAIVVPKCLVSLTRLDKSLASASLCRLLWRLSLVRTVILISVTVVLGLAVHSGISSWWIAAAVPPVIIAAVLSFLPAGIGVNEFSFAGLLGLTGVALPVSAAFALANRVLQVLIAVILAGAGVAIVTLCSRNARHNAQRRGPSGEVLDQPLDGMESRAQQDKQRGITAP